MNCIQQGKQIPEQWAEGAIIQLHKRKQTRMRELQTNMPHPDNLQNLVQTCNQQTRENHAPDHLQHAIWFQE